MVEFRKETIYFIVIDRFFDGNPENNFGKSDGLYDPARNNWAAYWGGDLNGIIQKLDYLQNMGISAIWITPVFDQIDFAVEERGFIMAPYHGYWAKDFKRIDEHLVDRPEDVRVFQRDDTIFDTLIREMHQRGMKLILDIVCNHSNPHTAGGRGELYDDGKLLASYNTDQGSWYHHFGGVQNWNDLSQVQNNDLCGLSDFNEESINYRNYIKEAIKLWLKKGVDALRVDTVKHMPLWFWQEFVTDIRTAYPDVFIFGEWFLGGANDPASVNFANNSGMSMIDFSLRQAIEDTFAKNYYQGFMEIVEILNRDQEFYSANELVTFVDNHDMPRFLSVCNDPERLRLAIDLIMILRGIPCIYYGTEQYLHNDTDSGNDPYNRPMMEKWDTTTPIYRDVSKLARLRMENEAIQKGGIFHHIVKPSVYVFSRKYMGNICFAAVNKGDAESVQINDCPLPDGIYRDILSDRTITVINRTVDMPLRKNDFQVYALSQKSVTGTTVIHFQLNGYRSRFGETVQITGDCEELGAWDISKSVEMEFINLNTWAVDIPFDKSCNQFIHYKYVVSDGNRLLRENTIGRKRLIGPSGYEIWKDNWKF